MFLHDAVLFMLEEDLIDCSRARASAEEKFPGGEQRKKDRKIRRLKNSINSTFKPLSTIFVLFMKIQGSHTAPPPHPRCRRPSSRILKMLGKLFRDTKL